MCCCAFPAYAAGEAIEIPAGINSVDFDGDGADETVVKAWRGNGNAHGFYALSFYKTGEAGALTLLPVEEDGDYREMLFTAQGADCAVTDYWLLREGAQTKLLKLERDMGQSYAEDNRVTYEVYGLNRNEEGLPGVPEAYFRLEKQGRTDRAYCDVGEALGEVDY